MKNRRTKYASLFFALGYFAFFPEMGAVLPQPDGGYPGNNTAEGQSALFSLTTGTFNTAVGSLSLKSDTTGGGNTAIGAGTLFRNTGDQNTATGLAALLSNTTGAQNTANGALALLSNTTGSGNTAFGCAALLSKTTGSGNTAVGLGALSNITSGENNIALGENAGVGNAGGGSNNIYIGNGGSLDSDTIRIGIQGVQTRTFIAGISGTAIVSGAPVTVDGNGQLGVALSSRRFKSDIEPMNRASEAILALEPVTFHYKNDQTSTPQFGLIAEDVAKVNPDLVVHDKEGKPYSVRYDQVNAMVLNEFLKEHRKVEELEATMVRQTKRMDALTAQLKEQAAQIQKVSIQIQMDNSPKTVLLSDR
jgi:endosialidase-like protein